MDVGVASLMSSQPTFKGIPILQGSGSRAPDLGWVRIFTRVGMLAALILIPLLGIFRIDLSSGFVVFGHQIWFGDFFIVFGFWLSAACLLVIAYSSLGAVFCGWACPQNTFSTWANGITSRLLGKRAIINWGDEPANVHVSSGKNKVRNWIWLAIRLLAMSMLIAIIPLLYFLPPESVWSFVTLRKDATVTGSIYWIYSVFVFLTLTNIAVVRHYVCRYMCIYRIWQHLFKTRDTLHIEHDTARSAECARCNYCATVCPVDIDPRDTLTYDSCINCGECISACDNLHKPRGEPGLLRFRFGRRKGKEEIASRVQLQTLFSRTSWVFPVLLFGLGMVAWGVSQYEPMHVSVYRAEIFHGDQIRDYRISIANKAYRPAAVEFEVEGLPDGTWELERSGARFTTAGRQDINLHIRNGLPDGLHVIRVLAQADNGWSDSFQFHHFVTTDRAGR